MALNPQSQGPSPPAGRAEPARPARPFRQWPRRVLIGVTAVTILCLLAAGSLYAYARYRLGQIKTIDNLPLSAGSGGGGSSANGLSPMNILLVGDNSRVGLDPKEAAKFGTPEQAGGSHSDVTMILHLDPKTGGAALLSIPRDLFVPLPAHNIAGRVGKIDSALNGTSYQINDGAAQLISTIQDDLGIPINHYVQINFDGFQRTVDALGGINMYFPTKLYDIDSALRTYQTGCLHLNGSSALAVVRARHLQYFTPGSNPSAPSSWPKEQQSDLARIRRDHTFLRVLAASVTSQGLTADLGKLNNILGALISQVTVDPGLKSELIPLVKRFRHANFDTIPELTLPITVFPDQQYYFAGIGYGQVDFPVEPADHQIIAQWQGSDLPRVDPSSVTVEVRNISNLARQATSTAAALASLGFRTITAGQATVPALTLETMVRYHPGSAGLAQAETVQQALAGSVMMQADPTVAAGTVALDTGTTLSVPGAAPSSVGTSGASSTTSPLRSGPQATTTTSTAGGRLPVSSARDQPAPWDPVACSPGQPVIGG
ncbi:MAG: LCP family protein [Actinomycetota bacterium]|nr:LCP family protein [Actinomycetota bacterium]